MTKVVAEQEHSQLHENNTMLLEVLQREYIVHQDVIKKVVVEATVESVPEPFNTVNDEVFVDED